MRQHDIWCVYVRSVWRGMPDCSILYIYTCVIGWFFLLLQSGGVSWFHVTSIQVSPRELSLIFYNL